MAIQVVSEASFIGPTTLHSYSMLIGGTSSIEERSKKVYEYTSLLKAQNQNQNQDTAKKDAVLRFAATYTYTTSPVYLQTRKSGTKTLSSSSTLHDFFNIQDHRNCLLIGSGNIKVKKSAVKTKVGHNIKSAFDSRWNEEASYFQSRGIEPLNEEIPNEKVQIQILELLIKTPFLVFLINASALFAAKLTKDGVKEEIFVDGKIHSPEYQFLLLAEDFQADGPPPLVWIFNQLTGKGGNKGKRGKRSTEVSTKVLNGEPHDIHTYLRVWASDSKPIQGDIKADRIVFKACCRAEINIKFPSILLHILPVPKEIIEKQGNKALTRSMERDLVPGVNAFREAFIKWQQRRYKI